MRVLKKLAICFSMVLLLLTNATTVFATNLAGDEVVYCNVNIIVSVPENYDGEEIKIMLRTVVAVLK